MALDLFKEIQAINRLFSSSKELERIRIPQISPVTKEKKEKEKEQSSPFTEDYHRLTWRLSLRAMIVLSMPTR